MILLCACAIGAAAELHAQSADRLVIVAPAAPGGGWDQTARALQQVMERERVARIVEVQNVPGAAGTIGLAQFVDAGPAQTGSLLVTGLVMVGATLWNDSPVSVGQATPIARLTGEYEVVAVPAGSPYADMRALVDAFRARPEAFTWGGGSAGGTDHILAGLIAEAAAVDPRRVNYVAFSGGGEAVAALLGGHVAAGISGYGEFAAHLETGRLRALAISAPSRVPGIEVPTLRDAGVNVEMVNWRGLLGAAGLPADERARLTSIVGRTVKSPLWQQILTERDWTDLYLDGAAFDAYLAAERTRIGRVVARLRGPATGTPITAGRSIFPTAILAGVLLVAVGLAVRRTRHEGTATQWNSSSVARVCLALLAFVVLLRPLGFVIAAAALFVLTTTAFHVDPGGARQRSTAVRWWLVASIFAGVTYLAFTRALNLSLPAGAWHAWIR